MEALRCNSAALVSAADMSVDWPPKSRCSNVASLSLSRRATDLSASSCGPSTVTIGCEGVGAGPGVASVKIGAEMKLASVGTLGDSVFLAPRRDQKLALSFAADEGVRRKLDALRRKEEKRPICLALASFSAFEAIVCSGVSETPAGAEEGGAMETAIGVNASCICTGLPAWERPGNGCSFSLPTNAERSADGHCE